MKSKLLILPILLLVACEGEPPKTAAGASDVPPVPPPASTETDETAHTPSGHSHDREGCCNCGCGQGGAVATAASVDGGTPTASATASDAGAPQAANGDAAAAPAVVAHDIIGTVTTVPTYLSSMSVVWLEDAPKDPNRGMHARIDNHQMAFSPMVQVITAGGSVSFVNSDPFPHNVFSPDGDKFNMGSIAQNSSSGARKFEKPGTYTLLCNLHPGMLGYLVVAPSSYFARTDGRGHYRIKDVPAGTYKITAWAPRLPTVTQTVTVGGAEVTSDFELHR